MSTREYLDSLARVMGLDAALFDEPGTTVRPSDDRLGERLVSHYRVGQHSVLLCDPDVADELHEHGGAATALEFDAFRSWAIEHDAVRLGTGYEHLLPDGWEAPPRPGAVVSLDGSATVTIDLVADLLDACSDDDRDGAEFDLGALDPSLCGWDDEGALLALAGGRPWDRRPGFHDIGVIVRPDVRRRGLGAAVVAAASADIVAAGNRPLYRCEADNAGSWLLCRSVGFELVVELEAFRWLGPR